MRTEVLEQARSLANTVRLLRKHVIQAHSKLASEHRSERPWCDLTFPQVNMLFTVKEKGEVTIKDSIADNAANAAVILGGKLTHLSPDIDLRLTGMVFEKNGEIIDTAAGAAVLGNPAEAVAWLANKLSEHGNTLRRGEFVISGSLTQAVYIESGAFFRVTFDRLGSVSAYIE